MNTNERELTPREWLIHGGGGHEDGEDGIRALPDEARDAPTDAQQTNPYESAHCNHTGKDSPGHVHSHACVEPDAQEKPKGSEE